MNDLKKFPHPSMATIEMLAFFTKSCVALTMETGNSLFFIWAAPDKKKTIGKESDIREFLLRTADISKETTGWIELSGSYLLESFDNARFFNLTMSFLSGISRLCLLRYTSDFWEAGQLVLTDQTRKILEQQFESYFFGVREEVPDNTDRFCLKEEGLLFHESGEHLKKFVPEFTVESDQARLSDNGVWNKEKTIVARGIVPGSSLDLMKTSVFDRTGTKRGIVIPEYDISSREKTGEMLFERATQDNDIVFEWDFKTDRMRWFGKTGYIGSEKIPPRTFSDFIQLVHDEDRARISSFWREAFPQQKEWKDEFRVELENGEFKYYRGSGIMIFKDSYPEKAIGTFTNITQEKALIKSLREAVEEAQQNQARMTGLLSGIPDSIFVFDGDGIIRDYHAESVSLLYVTPEMFIDHKVEEVMPAKIASLTHEKISAVSRHKGIETYEYEMTGPDGPEVYESRMVYVDDNRFMTIVRDVTHARKVEKDLIEAKEQAEKSDRLKSAFLANMSHEIRTPMNGIIGFSELLRSNNLEEEEKNNCIDVIVKSGQQLLAIINDVLEVSRLETGQVQFLPDRVNLNRLISDLARFFEIEAGEKSVSLDFSIPKEELHCFVDGGKITQVFNNLISNAFKFTSPGGHIVFGFKPDKEIIRFFVHDDGVGIAPKHHKVVFERFRQVVKIGAENKGGTGLGLSICKSLVELMGGQIWVESAIGKGASFYFTLPLK